MNTFIRALRDTNSAEQNRTWVFVPYDQLSHEIGPLAELAPEQAGIVLIETTWKGRRRPYHKQKLAWILSNQRHFALEQAKRGVAVRYVFSSKAYSDVLEELADELGPFKVARPAERELRVQLQDAPFIEICPHTGWLTTEAEFDASQTSKPWRMDAFYREVRQRTGILMEDGKPEGGRYSFDGENRNAWKGEPALPVWPKFEVDEIDAEVADLIEDKFGHHPGKVDMTRIASTAAQAEAHWQFVLDEILPTFGPYEDAMTVKSRTLFHTLISPLVNLHRLLPARVVADADAADIDLASKEGFIRQVIGWREFMYRVHEKTDGFRDVNPVAESIGRAGWEGEAKPGDGGALPNFFNAKNDLPPAFWGTESGMRCLDESVQAVIEDGYTHHIERLMVLGNIATLLDVDPRQLTDWFWVAFIDAFDWVVEPNVLGMATFATGELFTTKPYVSGSNYINKMSDYCKHCVFDPKKDCPLKRMYWAFLGRHEDKLRENNRMRRMYWTLDKRSPEEREEDARMFEETVLTLAAGESLAKQASLI